MKTDSIALYEVGEELGRIRAQHNPFVSPHEGLGVLMEEFHELQLEIYKRPTSYRPDLMRAEAIQVAAVAVRLASDLAHDESKIRPRTMLLRDQAVEQCERMRQRWLESERTLLDLRAHASRILGALVSLGDETPENIAQPANALRAKLKSLTQTEP